MKIRIEAEGHNFSIPIPTTLFFSKGTVWLANRVGRKYAGDAMADIPPEALDKLFAEFRRIKKRYDHWELVEVQSASGERIEITL